VQEVCLQVDRILYTDAFTKILFVQFHPSALLSRIAETMRRLSVQPSAYRLDPHLSLMYKHMGDLAKQHLVAMPSGLLRLQGTHAPPRMSNAGKWCVAIPCTDQAASAQRAVLTRCRRGARCLKALSIRLVHRSGGSKTWESEEIISSSAMRTLLIGLML
jgi:hypothetical protein